MFLGVNCETEINECSPNPCLNKAECKDLVGQYLCTCPVGYTGGCWYIFVSFFFENFAIAACSSIFAKMICYIKKKGKCCFCYNIEC